MRLLLKRRSWLQYPLVTQVWSMAVAAGLRPGLCPPSDQDEAPGSFTHAYDTVGFLPLSGCVLLPLKGLPRPQRDTVARRGKQGIYRGAFPHCSLQKCLKRSGFHFRME